MSPTFLVIDLFCGAGGTTTGFAQAELNGQSVAKVIACVNHDPKAIKSHWLNHPEVKHFEEDIRTLDLAGLVECANHWKTVYPNALLVLWASLECTNFSKAKGGLPRDPDSRTLANHLHRYVQALKPDYIQIENLMEFKSWGPLDKNGKPESRKNGIDWVRWCQEMCNHGYVSDWRAMNAADFGARTSRPRLFGVFVTPGLPNIWPDPTHSKNPEKSGLFVGLKKWEACRPCLDMKDQGSSMFTPGRIKSPKTFERVLAGCIRFIAGMGYKEFITKHFSGKDWDKSISIDGPAGTITCKDHHAIVQAEFLSHYYKSGGQHSSINAPAPTIPTKARTAKISAQWLDKGYSNPYNYQSIDAPAGVITGSDKYALMKPEPFISDTSFNNIGQSIEAPLGVITANQKWHYLMNPQWFNTGCNVDDPCFTLIARMDKAPPYLVQTESGHIAIEVYATDIEPVRKLKYFMAMYGIADIKMRMLKVSELKKIQGFPENYHLFGSQADQKKFIGNSVVPQVVKAWAEALALKLLEKREVAA